MTPILLRSLAVIACALVLGCAANRKTTPQPAVAARPDSSTAPATAPVSEFNSILSARVSPPPGWRVDVKSPARPNVRHILWVSPSGKTAFGVMRFSLPMPVPHDPILWVFMNEMRRSEGEAAMLTKVWDKTLPGVRFEAEGGRYKMRTNLRLRGLTGWMAYAGTSTSQPVDEEELKQAEAAREATRFGAGE